jgi:hypothetical protein
VEIISPNEGDDIVWEEKLARYGSFFNAPSACARRPSIPLGLLDAHRHQGDRPALVGGGPEAELLLPPVHPLRNEPPAAGVALQGLAALLPGLEDATRLDLRPLTVRHRTGDDDGGVLSGHAAFGRTTMRLP